LVSQSVLLVTDSPTAIHPIGTALTPWGWGLFFKVYSFRSAVFCTTGSPLVGCGSSLCTDSLGWRGAVIRIYHPWRIARALIGPPLSPLGNMMTPVWPGRLPLALSLPFTPQLGPGVYWFCMWCFYHGIALAYDIPPPIVLF
jgi:hypothetical protein